MEGKGSFFVLIIIIAILTLTLAVAVGYLFIAGGNQAKTVTVVAEQTVKEPKDDELAKIELFADNNFFNLKSDDDKKLPVIMVSAEVEYFIKIKDYKGKPEEKLSFHLAKIQEMVGTYFQGLTIDDVKQLDAKEKASKELAKQINEYLSKNEKQKYEFVHEIIFPKWICQ